MEEQLILLFLMPVITGIISWQSYKINDFNVEGIIFGIRIPEKYRDDKKIKDVIKDYNKKITILTLIDAVIFFILYFSIQKTYLIMIYSYILVFINMYSCCLANKNLKVVKKDIGWEKESENKVYVQIGKNKEKEKSNLSLFYIAGIISMIGLAITILKFPSLPKMVPIHFGVNGPNNWADSTTLNGKLQVIGLPVISIVCIWSMFFSAKFQVKKDSTKFNGGTISSLILKKSYSAKSMTKMFGILSIGISVMIFWGILFVVGILEFTNTANYIFMIITIFVILFPMTYWIYNAKKAKVIKSENDSNEKEIYRDDDKYYIGGIFYYNQDDPSNVVSKRMGYGLNFNYAHILGKIISCIGIIILLAIPVIMFLLNV